MKKRLFAILLALTLVCSIFVGVAETTYDEFAECFPLDETYTVSAFAFSNTGNELDKTLSMQVMEEHTNIHFDLTMVNEAELKDKLNLSINGGEYYDVYIKSGIGDVELYKYGSQGIFLPLNDLINEYMPNLKAILDERNLWSLITSADGNIYSLPQIDDASLAAPSTFINKKWIDTLGMQVPTTPEEFAAVLKAFVTMDPNGNGENDEYGIYCPSGAVEYTFPIFGIAMDYGTYSMYDGENVIFVPTSQQYKDFLAFWAQGYQDGIINKDCFTATWDDINAIGATSDTLGTIPTWGVYQHVGTERDEDYVNVLPFNGAHTIPNSSGVKTGAMVITDACEKPELLCQWADYFYSQEGATLARMGVSGDSYILLENGTKYDWNTEGKWGGDINSVRNSATMYGWYPAPMVASKFFQEGNNNPEELFLYKQRVEQLEYAAPSFPVLNWTAEELDERAGLITTISSYYYEYMAQVITGQVDLESSWDGYVEAMKNMNVDRLNEIDSAAYSRWYAEQN